MNNLKALKALKEHLQIVLSSSTEGLDYNLALEDATYSCQFETETALIEWMWSWVGDTDLEFKFDIEYQRGVQFVQNMWNEIVKGEEG